MGLSKGHHCILIGKKGFKLCNFYFDCQVKDKCEGMRRAKYYIVLQNDDTCSVFLSDFASKFGYIGS
jgi:hypothetical protein